MKLRHVFFSLAAVSSAAFACSASSAGRAGGTPGSGGSMNGDATGGTSGAAGAGGIAPQPDSGPSGDGGSINLPDGAAAASGASGASGTPGVGGAAATAGCGEPPPGDVPVPEQCGNGLDDDLNGFVDENCPCTLGISQPCFGGYPSQANMAPLCVKGMQHCTGTAEFHGWGPCEGWMCGTVAPPDENLPPVPVPTGYVPMDEDCDGLFDEGCGLNVNVMLSGDCSVAACPPQAPFPIGCMITLDGGDSRGCVSTAPGNGIVYFKEGNACCFPPPPLPPIGDCGDVNGTMYCSSQPGPGLNEMNCPINKQQALYPTAGGPPDWGCPQ